MQVLKEVEVGRLVEQLCPREGTGDAAFHRRGARYSALEMTAAQRLCQLVEENRPGKRIVAQQTLDFDALKAVVSREIIAPRAERELVRAPARGRKAQRAIRLRAGGDAATEMAGPAERAQRGKWMLRS